MSIPNLQTVNTTITLAGMVGTLGGPQSGSIPLFRLPGTAYGGGITIVRWDYSTNFAVASGSAPAVRLVSQTSANAPIATLCTNGSAQTTSGTAVSGSITTAWVAGTVGFLACEWTQATYGGTAPLFMNVSVQYLVGRGSA